MMKNDTPALRRMAGAAVALALTVGGALVAVPAAAQDGTAKETTEQRTEVHKIIVRDGKGEREVSPELRAKMEKCPGEKFEVTSGAQPPQQKQEWKVSRAKILICAKAGETNEQKAAGLEKALSRLETQSELPADVKADMVAKIKARIAELRAGQ